VFYEGWFFCNFQNSEKQEVNNTEIRKHLQTLINESSNITFIVLAIGWNY